MDRPPSESDIAWMGEIERIRRASRTAQKMTDELFQWLWRNVSAGDVVPREVPSDAAELIGALRTEIDAVERAVAAALDRYQDRPLDLFLKGFLLTREQYHLLAAMRLPLSSAKLAGLSMLDDYDVFCMFHYEDDNRRAYINPDEAPRQPGRIKIRFGVPPEELDVNALRPEQLAFFEEYLPDVLARFRGGSARSGT